MSTPAPKIKGLAHRGLNVSDPVYAARWYCDILSVKEIVTGYDSHQEAAPRMLALLAQGVLLLKTTFWRVKSAV